jgi:hypothetical protein
VYLFLAVTLNQWASIKVQRDELDDTVEHLLEVQANNDKRQQELETLSVIHSTIMAGREESVVLEEITRRVSELTGAGSAPSSYQPASGGLIRGTASTWRISRPLPRPPRSERGRLGDPAQRIALQQRPPGPRYDGLRAGPQQDSRAPQPPSRSTRASAALVICTARAAVRRQLTRLERLPAD